jgi:hypothetical protein
MGATTVNKNASGYGYKYTDIAEIHGWLEEQGYRYYQYIERIDGDDYMYTVPIIDGKEQPARRGCKVITAPLGGKTNPAQEQGSGITYARRYSLLMAFGLATADDDAQCMTREIKSVKQDRAEQIGRQTIGEAKIKTLISKCEESGINPADVCAKCNVKELSQLTEKQFAWIAGNWSKEFANGK